MLTVLLESNAPRQRRRASMVASIVAHTVIIAGAIAATASAKAGYQVQDREAAKVYILRPPLSPERRTGEVRPQAASRATNDAFNQPTVPRIPAIEPVPAVKGVDEIDPRKLLMWGDSTAPGDRARIDRGVISAPSGPTGGEPATIATVERAATLMAPPRPRYPDMLRAAGVTGLVVVRLVVDTTGRVEPASVVIRESGHDLFAEAVRAVLPSLRFTPAEVGGRKVRMLVDLPFEFRLRE